MQNWNQMDFSLFSLNIIQSIKFLQSNFVLIKSSGWKKMWSYMVMKLRVIGRYLETGNTSDASLTPVGTLTNANKLPPRKL